MAQQTRSLEYYRLLPYTLRTEPLVDSDGTYYWVAKYEELRGCKTDGATEAEAIANVQELLGHNSSKTTEIYTHVSNKSLGAIVSPLDTATARISEIDDTSVVNTVVGQTFARCASLISVCPTASGFHPRWAIPLCGIRFANVAQHREQRQTLPSAFGGGRASLFPLAVSNYVTK